MLNKSGTRALKIYVVTWEMVANYSTLDIILMPALKKIVRAHP